MEAFEPYEKRVEKPVEMKLASGMTNPGRLKDPADFADRLHPYVRPKCRELSDAVQADRSP